MYGEYVLTQYQMAEAEIGNAMLNREGMAKRIDPLTLFSGRSDVAWKYASEELRRFWDSGRPGTQRLTFAAFSGDSNALYRARKGVAW